MKSLDPHIILVGFKHVGKSTIAEALSLKIQKNCVDLDQQIEAMYAKQYPTQLTCREIMQHQGEPFFRALEQKALQQVIEKPACIIATGGGTPMQPENYKLMAPHYIIHITAKPELVFERIMQKERPAFFSATKDPWIEFQRLWQTRETTYKQLATFSVENNDSISTTVEQLIEKLP